METIEFYQDNIENFVKKYVTLDKMTSQEWYKTAFIQCDTIAKVYNVPSHVIVAMVAICSPLVAWGSGENVNTVINIIKSYHGIENDGKFSGFSRNVNKAKKLYSDFQNGIISSELESLSYVTGPKVSRFFDNILHYDTSIEITVDIWMARISRQEWQSPTNVYELSKKQQNDIRLAYIAAWQNLQLARYNISPCMFQAALWETIKQKDIAFSWFSDFNKIVNFK